MGTVKKLGIASIVGAMMALMFAVGLMPSPGALGVFAASGDGPKDVRDIMDLILGTEGDGEKGVATGVTITDPEDGSTVYVRQDSPTAVLPVHATLDPDGTEGTVRVGINGVINPVPMTWNGDIASPATPIQAGDGITVTSVDIAPLGTAALATTSVRMYGLGIETLKQFGAITINYTVLDQIDFDLQVVDSLVNPFTEIGDGEIYIADEPDLAGTDRMYTYFADLNVTGGLLPADAKGLAGREDLNGVVTVPVELGGGPTGPRVIVQAVSLADLQAAFPTFIGAGEQAVLVVRVASTAAGLAGPDDADDLADIPTPMTPGAQLVQIAIIYTTDGGVGVEFAEVEDLRGLDIPVVLTFENLPATKQLSLTRGVAVYGHDSFIDFAPDPNDFIEVPDSASVTWLKRFGSVLDPFNQILTIDLEYLSVFSAFESALAIDAVVPGVGGFAGGDSVVISGDFPQQEDVDDADAYIVFFGDPADPTREALVTGTTVADGTITAITVSTPGVTPSDNDVQVDVTVQDASTPSDFVTALQAFTYSAGPILDSIMPNMGPLNPTTAVRLAGMHLAGLDAATKVYFGVYTVPSSEFTAADPAGMFVDVIPPAMTTPGTVDVSIMTVLGMYTLYDGFEYFGPAIIDSFDPMTGLDDGGQTVVIMGSNFFGTLDVELAGVPVASVDAVNAEGTQLTVTTGAVVVPSGEQPPEGLVSIDNGSGENTSAETFRYLSDPIIDTFDPMVGPASGGQTVTITGEHLRDITSITVAGNPVATLPVETFPYTSIEIATPPGNAGDEGSIVVSSAGGVGVSVDNYRYEFDTPVIDSIVPAQGSTAGGDTVTITGGGFSAVTSVTIAGVPAASFDVLSDTQIDAVTAAVTVAPGEQPPQGPVVVANPDAMGTSLAAFRYIAPPVIDSFAPTSGDALGGDLVTIMGEHLNPLDITNMTVAGFSVDLGTLGDVSPVGAPFTVLEFTTPPGDVGAQGPIEITNVVGDVETSAQDFLYELLRPIIDSFTPLVGPTSGGTEVTITGNGFIGTTDVTIAGIPAASFTVDSITQITAITAPVTLGPGEEPPAGPITVANPEGVSNESAENFRYVAPPVIDSFTPTSGPGDGGTIVTIMGANLRDIETVTVAGVTVTAPVMGVMDPFTSITIETPAAPFGTAPGPIVVTTAGGAATSAENFTYEFDIEDLTVDAVAPNDAWIFGGVITEISGTGLVDDPAFVYNVLFGTEAATVVGFSGDGGLLVQVPPSADVDDATVLTDTVDVTVARVINGSMNPADPVTAPAQFTYTRIAEDGGVITTAAKLDGGVGMLEIALDATGTMNATLDVPVNTGSAAGVTTDVFVLARASTMLDSFGTTPDVAANGTNFADSYTYFDIHFYRQGPAPATPTAGDFGLTEVTDGFEFGEGDQAAMLSTVVDSENISVENVQTGLVALFQDATSAAGAPRTLRFPSPSAVPVLTAGTVERYQSMLLDGEYTTDATDTFVESLVDVRISNLGVIVVRDNVVLDFDALGIMPFLASEDMSSLTAQVPVRIESNRGGLGYIERIEIIERETGETKVIPRTALPNLANSMGENEFFVTAMMPTVNEPGVVDIEVFLPSGSSFTLPDVFEFTKQPGESPLVLILLALAALFGLAAAGGGGGGGGPCFIATAAYGTPVAAEIEVLRDVRDSYLLDNAVGAAFVDVYYTVSPAIADVVAQSPVLAALVRIALMPVIFFGQMVLTAPLATVTIALMAMALALAHRVRKRAQRMES